MQKFDSLAAKFLKLIPMSQAPKNGVYADTNGNICFAIAGVTIFKASATGVVGAAIQALTVDGAISPSAPGSYVITKAGVLAATLAAPAASPGGNGIVIDVSSTTANAHTITATGLLQTGTVSVNVATFAAQAGAGLRLMSYNGKWIVKSAVGITFS